MATAWHCVLELTSTRTVHSGSVQGLSDAIRRAADLRISTEFLHSEHIDPSSPSRERIREVAEFGVTFLIEDQWTAGVMSLRQPIELPSGFGPRPSMSFFLYNQDGRQAIARPYLDGPPPVGQRGPGVPTPPDRMPKYHALDAWDVGTNAPSHNFIYEFDVFRYCVADAWQEVLAHDATGRVERGRLSDLVDAFSSGCEVKVGVRGLCSDLARVEPVPSHEVFVQIGSTYYYTDQKLFIGGSHPVVRVEPGIPMQYATGNWDFGWLMVRSDGRLVYRRCDPYTLRFEDRTVRHSVRWFVR